MNTTIYYYILYAWIALGIVSFPFLLKKTAPYGRHTTPGWGPMISNQLGWMIMEGVAPIFMSIWFWLGELPKTNFSYFLYGVYVLHYIYRAYIFPFRTKTAGKKIPLVISSSAVFFNFCNTFVLGYYLGNMGGNYDNTYFMSMPFMAGLLVLLCGVFINVKSDNMLIALRKPGETGYKIPRGFLFEYVSCPNHFGEIIEWTGYAIMFGALPGWSFALWTAINLIPRTLDHHRWYQATFTNYPSQRKAVIPFVL